ncbi:MAG: hypothetical protein JO156_08110, partial [Solirubrobacterales bacterium]|nr:hypothetical protein [Solirubrobacterales bacterium]
VFTYGPLGFLSVNPLWFFHLGELSFAYLVVVRVGLAAALLAGARRTFGGLAAFVLAALVAAVDEQLPELTIALIVTVLLATSPVRRRRSLIVLGALGAFAALEVLNKVSYGVGIGAMAAVLALTLPGRRRDYLVAAAAGFVVAFALLWAALGQDFAALPDFIRNSAQIVGGYAAAMSSDVAPGYGWQYTAAFFALALGVWGAWHCTAGGGRRQRLGVVLLWVAFWFFAFKESFVRWDLPHSTVFFGAVLGGFLAFGWRRPQRLAALLGTAALMLIALVTQGQSLTGDLDPTRNLSSAFDQLRAVVSPSRRGALAAAGRALIKSTEPIDATSLSLVAGHTVSVYPQEIALIWAYGLRWRPIPVLQSYVAYTSALDHLDASFLNSSAAPQRILMQPPIDIDFRVPSFDQPLTSRTILCRYRVLHATTTNAVLADGSNRCSTAAPLETVRADWGQAVAVPPPPTGHSLVSVRVEGLGVGGFERLKALFWKPAMRLVSLNGKTPNRLVGATAGDGLPLRASPGVDLPAPFGIVPGATTIAVAKGGLMPHGGHQLTYRFFWQSVGS